MILTSNIPICYSCESWGG